MVDTPSPVDRLLDDVPSILDEKLLGPLRHDLVNRINDYDVIARRYGLRDETGLIKWLEANPIFAQEVGRLRALFASDMSTQERARLKALLASEEAIPEIFGVVMSPASTPAQKVDAFKQLNRMGGVDGLPPAAKDAGGSSGTQFSLTINMPSGRQEIVTTVVDEVPLPPPEDDE